MLYLFAISVQTSEKLVDLLSLVNTTTRDTEQTHVSFHIILATPVVGPGSAHSATIGIQQAARDSLFLPK